MTAIKHNLAITTLSVQQSTSAQYQTGAVMSTHCAHILDPAVIIVLATMVINHRPVIIALCVPQSTTAQYLTGAVMLTQHVYMPDPGVIIVPAIQAIIEVVS